MKSIFRLAVPVGLALCGAAAYADDAYQFGLVAGTAAYTQAIVRTDSVSGESLLCPDNTGCMKIAEEKAIGHGSYRVMTWVANDGTNHTWNVIRCDAKSGRIWHVVYDGKTANWVEFKYP